MVIFRLVALVVSSSVLPLEVKPLLGGEITYRAPDRGQFDRATLLQEIERADALISLLNVRVDAELLAAAPRLNVVANFAVGYDNVDVPLCTSKRIVVTNTPDVLTEATADFTFALLLGAARRLCEGQAMVREDRWTGWAPDLLLGEAVAGQVLGIIGLGRIGQAVARRARGFGMQILYAGPKKVPGAEQFAAEHVPLPVLLERSDFVTLHCPSSRDTQNVINRESLLRMKKSAFLINTARGACVDEAALIDALDRGVIKGAALDVFADEPRMAGALRQHPRVLLAPHAASATVKARRRMAELCVTAVRAVLSGSMPENALNPEARP